MTFTHNPSRARRRLSHLFAAVALLLVSTAGVLSISEPAQAATSSTVTVTKTVTRSFVDADGTTKTVGSKKVTLTVDKTKDLHSLQLINVSWSGAQPTGGLVPNQNSDTAQNEEYPFVLFECRGTDSSAHPISPDTCWTQTADERFTSGSDDPPYPAWRADSKATTAQRQAIVDAPKPVPSGCRNNLFGTTVQRWVPFKGADGTNYPGGPFGCAGLPPEAASASLNTQLTLPSNETFGVTDSNGTGSTNFDIFTQEDHASLGCSASVACSLVAVPIMGLSCDPYGKKLPASQQPDALAAATAKQNCEAGPKYQPGQLLPSQGSGETAVSGAMWWSPSNWANRLSVPLTFATADDVCSLSNTGTPLQVYGSEVMSQASSQWAPHFCLNSKLFNYKHVITPEPQAASLLGQGQISAAYTSDAPDTPYQRPTVNAPVAVTGFGIGYSIDDNSGKPVTDLKLDARLLAKLLTQSYPAQPFVKSGHPGETGNPLNISYDPEFQALNPGIPETNSVGASTLFTLNTTSDVIEAVTSYINADPEARAFLSGQPDPWGTVVNPFYKNIALPTNKWQLLDTYEPRDVYKPGLNDCLAANPVPYLPLVAAPTSALFTIAQDVQFALSPSQTICVTPSPIPGDTTGSKMVAAGRQASGHHFMLGTVSLGDADRNGLTVASLQTQLSSSAPAKFTNPEGRSFAAADAAGLKAAAQTLVPDAKTGLWPVPYSTLSKSPDAYPGTMVVYASVPTIGLTGSDPGRLATLLRFAAGAGQESGTAQGQLPPGFLPMTAGNGLGDLAAYTLRAANAVQGQSGCLPSLTKATPSCETGGTNTGGTSGSTSGGSTGSTGATSGGTGGSLGGATGGSLGGSTGTSTGTTGGATGATSGKASSSTSSSGNASPVPVSARTPAQHSGVGGWVLPVLLILGLVALLAGLVVRVGVRRT